MGNGQIYQEFELNLDYLNGANYGNLFSDLRERLTEKGYIVLESSRLVNGLPRKVIVGIDAGMINLLNVKDDFFELSHERFMPYFSSDFFFKEPIFWD